MKKVIVGLSVGLLFITLGAGAAYSHDRDSRDSKVIIKTGPKISVNLPSLGIRVNFARNNGAIWVPGHWQCMDYRRGYAWVPGHFEKRPRYYSAYRRGGRFER
ncbi:MAG: hypothetical protein WC546_06290 [Candidatus Omnitrophota bacterium]